MRKIARTSKFDRRLVVFVRSHPDLSDRVQEIIDKIIKNPFDRSLKTHKLSGSLRECFGANITYGYRIIFTVNGEELCFVDIGPHDKVY